MRLPVDQIQSQDIPDDIIPVGLVTQEARLALAVLGFEWAGTDPDSRTDHVFLQQFTQQGGTAAHQVQICVKPSGNVDDVREAIFKAGWDARRDYVAHALDALKSACKAPVRFLMPVPPLPEAPFTSSTQSQIPA